MTERITVIKAAKRNDLWDFNNNKPIEDKEPIGYVYDTFGAVPEGYIKWIPNKIFDKRKYPDLYALFGKDHLPNDLEMKCFVQKHYHEWHNNSPKEEKSLNFYLTIIFIIFIMTLGLIILG